MKKGIFIVAVLIFSLITVQVVVMKTVFKSSPEQTQIQPMDFEMKPVSLPQKDQFFIMEDHVIILKDGKYYVVDRKKAT